MSRTRLRESRHSRRYGVTTFLIPFTDPDSGERLVRRLLDKAQADSPEVELLAVVASPEPNLGRLSLSPQRVQELGRDIGNSWLMRLTPLLELEGSPISREFQWGALMLKSRPLYIALAWIGFCCPRPRPVCRRPSTQSRLYPDSRREVARMWLFMALGGTFVAFATPVAAAAGAVQPALGSALSAISARSVSWHPAFDCAGAADCTELLASPLR